MNTTNSQGIKWGPFTLRIPFIHIKFRAGEFFQGMVISCLLYTSPSPRDVEESRMPSSA